MFPVLYAIPEPPLPGLEHFTGNFALNVLIPFGHSLPLIGTPNIANAVSTFLSSHKISDPSRGKKSAIPAGEQMIYPEAQKFSARWYFRTPIFMPYFNNDYVPPYSEEIDERTFLTQTGGISFDGSATQYAKARRLLRGLQRIPLDAYAPKLKG